MDFLPDAGTKLEPGDRVRVVASTAQMRAVSKFFGDSYRALSRSIFSPSAWASPWACCWVWFPSPYLAEACFAWDSPAAR